VSRARSLLPGSVAVVALVAGSGCSMARLTSRTDVVRYHALARAAVGPLDPPAWTGAATSANAAFVAWVPGGAALVAYSTMERVGTNPNARRAVVTRLVLHDARTGAPRWEATTSLLGQVTLLATHPAFVLLHEGGAVAFDAATGRVAWDRKESSLALAVDLPRSQLLVWRAGVPAPQPALLAIDLATGKDRWAAAIPPGVEAIRPQLEVIGSHVVAVGLRLALFRADSGAVVSAPAVDLRAPVVAAAAGGGVVVGDTRGRVVRVRPDGAVAWVAELRKRTTYLAASGDRLLAATLDDLHLLSVEAGSEAWRAQGEHAGAAAFAGARVIWCTRPKVLFLDAATGREVAAAPRSAVMQLGGLPDQLLLAEDQVTVVGETGVMAASLGARRPAGTVLWRLDLRGVWSSLRAGLRWSGGALSAVPTEFLPRPAPAPLPMPLSVKIENPAADRLERDGERMSTRERLTYIRLAEGQSRVKAQLEAATASLQASIAMLNAWRATLEAGMQLYAFAATQRQNALAQEATTLWLGSVQGDLLVRPIAWELGQGVLVADLRTGRWRELVTGPGEIAIDDFYLSHAPASVDADGGVLVTLGRAGPPVELHEFLNIKTTARTAQAYRLGDPRGWAAPEQYATRSRVPPSVVEVSPAAEKEVFVYRERITWERNDAGRLVVGKSTKADVRAILGDPGNASVVGKGDCNAEIWSWGNARPSGIEVLLVIFDERGLVCRVSM
jgi:outer membrane protein assembly factor BamB